MISRAPLFPAALAAFATPAAHAAPAPVCTLRKLAELRVRMLGLRPVITTGINGADTQLLVDTGVFQTVVSRATAERVGLAITPASIRFQLRGVGGEERDVGFAK